jgi:FkbM family methyltransferase
MPTSTQHFDRFSGFGKYAPHGLRRTAISLARSMPVNWIGRKVISLLRSCFKLRDFGPYDVLVFGQNFRLYPNTNRSDKNILTAPQFFDPKERYAIADFFVENPSSAFIDLGANIGVYSAFASSLGFEKIVAVEADPEVFVRLNFNLSDQVTKLNIAIAEEDGVLPFYINDENRGENSLLNKTGREVFVPTRSLLAVVRDHAQGRKYVLKLDVEGMELRILAKLFNEAATAEHPSLVIIEHLYAPEAAMCSCSRQK